MYIYNYYVYILLCFMTVCMYRDIHTLQTYITAVSLPIPYNVGNFSKKFEDLVGLKNESAPWIY